MHFELDRQMTRAGGSDVAIRAARLEDRAALVALAELDAAQPPLGGALVAEVAGSIVAALPLDGGRAFSDPFLHTGDLVALLEARAAQIGGRVDEHAGHGRLHLAALRRHA